jgi:hypothetical protein
MRFILNWAMDQLGYMPKINIEVGKVMETWPFPAEQEKPKRRVRKTGTLLSKATRTKNVVKAARAKKVK